MGWRDLLQEGDESVSLPWVGGRSLRSKDRTWHIQGKLPPEQGWHSFKLSGRNATWASTTDPQTDLLKYKVRGYLVGDHIVPDGASVDPDPTRIHAFAERVHFLEPGLDRFVRVVAGRVFEGGPLIYESLEMPLGPEDEVLQFFLDQKTSVDAVKGVAPALDAAFRMEVWQRVEAERRRAELERVRREEEARRAVEERRQRLVEQLGDAAGRREMARVDFGEAAKAALAVGGAVYLDSRDSYNRGEKVVRFRFNGQRFECVCDNQLRIVDSGICLTAHYDDDDFEEGTKGDTFFTLESLPGVIAEAQREGKLVVFRRVD
jgi:hypothetical protein